jgi:hypothetical protein
MSVAMAMDYQLMTDVYDLINSQNGWREKKNS